MAIGHITADDVAKYGVVAAPDVLEGDPSENKRIFDRLVREHVAGVVNEIIDETNVLTEAEVARAEAEAGRVTAEEGRTEAERSRVEAETARAEAEEARAAAEIERASAEAVRIAQERARVEAEVKRWSADEKGAADRILSNLTDPAQALSNLGAPAFISTFAQLGFTEATATDMIALVSAMPTRSIALLQCSTEAANNGLVPGSYGALLIHRQGLNVMCEFGRIGATVRHFGFVNLNQQNWSGWKQYATTDYAVNKAGDTMTGKLIIAGDTAYIPIELSRTVNSKAGLARFGVGTNDSAPAAAMTAFIDGTEIGSLLVGMSGPIYKEKTIASYNILHTGNKPSGSYTGNGDATARTIETGGIDSFALLIRNGKNGRSTIAMNAGAIVVRADGTLVSHPYTTAQYVDNNLTLATTDTDFNASGTTYQYQVL